MAPQGPGVDLPTGVRGAAQVPRMSSFATVFRPASALVLALSAAACGGLASVPSEPSGSSAPAPDGPPAASPTGDAPAETAPRPIPEPTTTPYTGLVGTTDVSILYPLPASGPLVGLLEASATGNHGPLLPRAFVDAALSERRGRLDANVPSGYAELRLVGLRLDPCAPREGAACASEVRAVFQAIARDATLSWGAVDGGFHVLYDVPSDDLVAMLRQILSRKAENGNLATEELGPHPILAAQGLTGAFARGLSDIVRYHLGGARVRRVTMFDHDGDPEGHGWTFRAFEAGGDGAPVAIPLPHLGEATQEHVGGGEPEVEPDASGHLAMTSVFGDGTTGGPDAVLPVYARPWEPGQPAAPADVALHGAALRVQDPTKHDATTTTCVNCHLADSAARLGAERFGLSTAPTFASPRPLGRVDRRGSVTNLHAFGWLGQQPAVMQRTANESALVAEAMATKLAGAMEK